MARRLLTHIDARFSETGDMTSKGSAVHVKDGQGPDVGVSGNSLNMKSSFFVSSLYDLMLYGLIAELQEG